MAWRPKNSDNSQSDQSPPSPQIAAILSALAKARQHRHHPTCACFAHNLYCCPEDEKWSQVIDRELGRLCG